MKKILIWSILFTLVITFSLLSIGCNKNTAAESVAAETTETAAETVEKPLTIGYSVGTLGGVYILIQVEYLRALVKDKGWEFIVADAGWDANTQSSQIEDLAAKVDVLLIFPVDGSAVVPVIKKVKEKYGDALTIMNVTTQTVPNQLEEVKAFAGPNSYVEAGIVAVNMVDYIEKNAIEKLNFIMLKGVAGTTDSDQRETGFYDKLKELGMSERFVNIETQNADWAEEKANNVVTDLITRHGDKIDYIYSQNDQMAIGAWSAVQSKGYKPGDILITGIDGNTPVMQYIEEGKMLGTVLQDPRQDAELILSVIEDINNGKVVEYFNYSEQVFINAENLEELRGLAY